MAPGGAPGWREEAGSPENSENSAAHPAGAQDTAHPAGAQSCPQAQARDPDRPHPTCISPPHLHQSRCWPPSEAARKGDGLLSSAKGRVAEGPQGPLLTASPRSSKGMQGSAPGSLGSRAQHLPPLASPSSSGYPPRSCPAHHHGDPRSQSAQRPWVPRIGTRQSSGVRAAGLGGQKRSWPPAPSPSTRTETGRPAKLVSSNFLVLIMLPLAPCSKSVTSSPLLGRIFYF